MSFEHGTFEGERNEVFSPPQNHIEDIASDVAQEVFDTKNEPLAAAEVAYTKAMITATLLLAEAKQSDIENPSLRNMDPEKARTLLSDLSWDRNVVDMNNVDSEKFATVPREIKEAQRLIFDTYQPSAEMESLQNDVFTRTQSLKDEALESDVEIWQSKEGEKRKSVLQDYAAVLSVEFGIQPPIEIVFTESHGAELVAAYVAGTGKILWPELTLATNSLFSSLEIVAHEVNHANQERLVGTRSDVSDAAWFQLADERMAFISSAEFQGRENPYNKKSNYLSIPQEKDSFNAQKNFANILDQHADSIFEKRFIQLGLPKLALTRDFLELAALHEILGDDITEKDIANLNISPAGKAHFTAKKENPEFVLGLCKEAVRIEEILRTHFKDVF